MLLKITVLFILLFIPLQADASDEKGWYPSQQNNGWYSFLQNNVSAGQSSATSSSGNQGSELVQPTTQSSSISAQSTTNTSSQGNNQSTTNTQPQSAYQLTPFK
jgi:hypothetical protein